MIDTELKEKIEKILEKQAGKLGSFSYGTLITLHPDGWKVAKKEIIALIQTYTSEALAKQREEITRYINESETDFEQRINLVNEIKEKYFNYDT